MWNEPGPDMLAKLPALYSSDDKPLQEIVVHMHFFMGGSDWFVAKFDGDDRFFGFVILNNDFEMAEWGYFSLHELKVIRVHEVEVDRDLHWQARKAIDVEMIRKARRW
jgi:hypothetical protein